ncbi:MAG TPA: M14 family zinc carboxypeptidase [Melioribacteraceae bacterium]|nr:M14 family zinc carboxypeptidase [Melioribacteraceae bacterium]
MLKNIDFQKLYDQHENYFERSISTERVTHSRIIKSIDRKGSDFDVEIAGRSIEGRIIQSITLGKGKKNILLWSQMHGDEPTATAALFDLFNFFSCDDQFSDFKKMILNKLSMTFIPMLNPDGAECHSRVNRINVDVNRDALRRITPEAEILWKYSDRLRPEFGFNLHDQNSYYTAGRSGKSSAISMLAPPFNFANEINESRKQSMQVISAINNVLGNLIPGHIARYKDDHEPRSFGDNFIGTGISSILIESGFIIGDRNKDLIRKLNFISLLAALNTIADESYKKINFQDYYSIPENQSLLFDLLIRNVYSVSNGTSYKVDIGINREKKFDQDSNSFFYKGKIAEIGDLSVYKGIEEHDLNGFTVEPGRVFEKEFRSMPENSEIDQLLKSGYCTIRLEPGAIGSNYSEKPINIVPSFSKYSPIIAVDEPANLILTDNKTGFTVLNGFLIPSDLSKNSILNGIVIS